MNANLRRSITLVFLFLAATVNLRLAAKSPAENAAEAIKKTDRQWAEAAVAKDLDKSVSFCGLDAAILPPNAPAAEGQAAIRNWFQSTFNIPSFKLIWHATSAEAAKSGELGYSTGKYELSFTDPSGKQVSDHGKYVTVWKKQADGNWKVARDIFNSDVSTSP